MHPLARKLSSFVDLSPEETSALAAVMANTFEVPAKATIALQGDRPDNLYFLLEGMVLRHKELVDGSRQILSVLLPGDPCDIGVTLLEQRDHSLTTVVASTVARVSDASLELLSSNYPKIRAALRWVTLAEEAVAREWLVNVGQRSAIARMAHLFCELFYRSAAIGTVENQTMALPLSQQDLADILGISAVHANRVLQELRAERFVKLVDGHLTILALQGLEALAAFDRSYLHLDARLSNVAGGSLLRAAQAAEVVTPAQPQGGPPAQSDAM